MTTKKFARDILKEVAQAEGVEIEDIKKRYGGPRVEAVRNRICWEIRQTGKSYQWIGDFLDGRNHTTIATNCASYERRLCND